MFSPRGSVKEGIRLGGVDFFFLFPRFGLGRTESDDVGGECWIPKRCIGYCSVSWVDGSLDGVLSRG